MRHRILPTGGFARFYTILRSVADFLTPIVSLRTIARAAIGLALFQCPLGQPLAGELEYPCLLA